MRMISWMIAIALGAMSLSAHAKDGSVLDFEAEVIEGEKRKPDLFIQMEGGVENMDSVLYSREDFNDYHETDRKWRPKLRRPPQPAGMKRPGVPKR